MAHPNTTVLQRLRRQNPNNPNTFCCPVNNGGSHQCGGMRVIDLQRHPLHDQLQQAVLRQRVEEILTAIETGFFELGYEQLVEYAEEVLMLCLCRRHSIRGIASDMAVRMLGEMGWTAPTMVTRG
ncbi:hypothetical protein LTR09_009476 [Extremus antarcticus]|uniref:Uncharacterized protein n=1 Tax=Extremus antarcticus TaxID=702011 RepID=A0AAJ0GBU7_9PEZI|nr:hypothetical protein LTR09_009476 [Extremus antarcticus]